MLTNLELSLCHFGFPYTSLKSRQGKIEDRYLDKYYTLRDIRNQLDRLTLTQSWSLRETDLWMYQRQLDRIDEARVNGNFIDAEGKPADLHDQRVCIRLTTLSKSIETLTSIV